LKEVADSYERDMRTWFVDDLIRVHTQEAIAKVGGGASDSMKPVFVIGMMRPGTSLVDQIISSHPDAQRAGELACWHDAVGEHEAVIRQGVHGKAVRARLADAYLRVLARQSVDAQSIIDKAFLNSDYLGVFHSVFQKARIIYMRRNPIGACLSCYFQQFSPALNFTMDLSDLAHYYREHHRLMAHWRGVLPPGTILGVPYEELVTDQEPWTRKMPEFLNLERDQRCLEFYESERSVATASYWPVRQRIYTDSAERWRNCEKLISPLLDLKSLDS